MPAVLYALAAAAFAIGTTEFVVVGLLPTLATALSVPVPTAGLLVTGYAAGVAVGGPLLPVILLLLALVLAGVAQAGPNRALTIVLLASWGAAGFALVPALQARVVAIAGPASTLAATLNIAAFNLGIAAGSATGGLLMDAGRLRTSPALGALCAPLRRTAGRPRDADRRPRSCSASVN
ncbi:hypothetical protein ACIOJE_18045 [Kitasatospora sp. NPDC087861]|uniref:hypothetical protein n=1 Tax=Kitasatospora sp. NPDC087861 TaxID=3364070 RepID=UPI003827E75D